jgi:hypothetical protein
MRFHFFLPSDFPNSFTLNLEPGFVQAGIVSFAFCPYTHVTSILQPRIKSNIGT